jgi:hypothetical protein
MTDCQECGRGSGHKLDCSIGRSEAARILLVPERCPCDHQLDGMYRCLNGLIYGPCNDPSCYGICDDTYGQCKSLEGCCEYDD